MSANYGIGNKEDPAAGVNSSGSVIAQLRQVTKALDDISETMGGPAGGADWTDHSSTITTANVSQTAIAANANRKEFLIQNRSSNVLYVNIGAAAATGATGGFELVKLQSLGGAGSGAINVLSATSGGIFVAKERT